MHCLAKDPKEVLLGRQPKFFFLSSILLYFFLVCLCMIFSPFGLCMPLYVFITSSVELKHEERILRMSNLSNFNKENLISNDDPLNTIAFISLNIFNV